MPDAHPEFDAHERKVALDMAANMPQSVYNEVREHPAGLVARVLFENRGNPHAFYEDIKNEQGAPYSIRTLAEQQLATESQHAEADFRTAMTNAAIFADYYWEHWKEEQARNAERKTAAQEREYEEAHAKEVSPTHYSEKYAGVFDAQSWNDKTHEQRTQKLEELKTDTTQNNDNVQKTAVEIKEEEITKLVKQGMTRDAAEAKVGGIQLNALSCLGPMAPPESVEAAIKRANLSEEDATIARRLQDAARREYDAREADRLAEDAKLAEKHNLTDESGRLAQGAVSGMDRSNTAGLEGTWHDIKADGLALVKAQGSLAEGTKAVEQEYINAGYSPQEAKAKVEEIKQVLASVPKGPNEQQDIQTAMDAYRKNERQAMRDRGLDENTINSLIGREGNTDLINGSAGALAYEHLQVRQKEAALGESYDANRTAVQATNESSRSSALGTPDEQTLDAQRQNMQVVKDASDAKARVELNASQMGTDFGDEEPAAPAVASAGPVPSKPQEIAVEPASHERLVREPDAGHPDHLDRIASSDPADNTMNMGPKAQTLRDQLGAFLAKPGESESAPVLAANRPRSPGTAGPTG